MVQEKYDTWRLPCSVSRDRIATGSSTLHYAIYLQLIVLTAGTLLPFFWIVVILGHRRQRNFERVLFFLCLALVFHFGASLLALNASLYYPEITEPRYFHASAAEPLLHFSWISVCIGLWFL